MVSDIEHAWITHLGLYKPAFPREIAFEVGPTSMAREVAYNVTEYIDIIKNRVDRGNLWICTQSKTQFGRDDWDKVFIDIDCDDLQEAYEGMRKLVEYIKTAYGHYPRVCFTANKGFAVYIDIPTTSLDGSQVKSWVDRIVRILDIPSDESVNGDKRRLCRLPYTWNTKSLRHDSRTMRMCVPINPEWSFDRILAESTNPTGVPYEAVPFPKVAAELALEAVYVPPKREPGLVVGNYDLSALIEMAQFIEDGRYRLIFDIVVPVCHQNKLGLEETLMVAMRFIEASGANFKMYEKRVENAYKWQLGKSIAPKKLDKILEKDPQILIGERSNGITR